MYNKLNLKLLFLLAIILHHGKCEERLVVNLRGYFKEQGLRLYITNALQELQWTPGVYITKKNQPDLLSDFVVLRVAEERQNEVATRLRNAPMVKKVSRDKSIKKLLSNSPKKGRPVQNSGPLLQAIGIQELWDLGFYGQDVDVAIFDTGLKTNHPHFEYVEEVTSWTDEGTGDDKVGHGTFVAGVVASKNQACPGSAPRSKIHIYKVFNRMQASYTSWFLDAFNHAIQRKVDVINLSIGGPDFHDEPFVDKVNELTSAGIIMVSAIGNDGPVYGTVNNPADLPNVIGVGGITYEDDIASFSSRGMTTWELPAGYGRFKPDVVCYGHAVLGSRPDGGCRQLSGTSVASPVIAGIIAVLISAVPLKIKATHVNPASIKQALVESATRLETTTEKPTGNIFEQGQGKVNVSKALDILVNKTPRVSIVPFQFDTSDCPYMWPYCAQAVYYGARPIIANFTLLNSMHVAGWVQQQPVFMPDLEHNGDKIQVSVSYSERLWPWSGWMSVKISITESAQKFQGLAQGMLEVIVTSPPHSSSFSRNMQHSKVYLPIRIKIIPTPPRYRRILWDQYHSISYPSGYFPRDDLRLLSDPLDWNGDHPHTNFRTLFSIVRSRGYFLEVLDSPFTCFDANDYGALFIVDPEEEFHNEEIDKLKKDVLERGLSLVVLADWYNTNVMEEVSFQDDNTRNWWYPETGGANIPALNDLLRPLGIELASGVYDGLFSFMGESIRFASGTGLIQFPGNSTLFAAPLDDLDRKQGSNSNNKPAILGFHSPSNANGGRIVVYGDSTCADDAHKPKNGLPKRCSRFLQSLFDFAAIGLNPSELSKGLHISTPARIPNMMTATRSQKSTLYLYSKVLNFASRKMPVGVCPVSLWLSHSELTNEARGYLSRLVRRSALEIAPDFGLDEFMKEGFEDTTPSPIVKILDVVVVTMMFLIPIALLVFWRLMLTRSRRSGRKKTMEP
eukprot:m.77620 g.77620  ORF g.77620 m.77620 type:complete len:960 (+) comp12634_c0_seq5:144-3023(+)